MGFNELAGATGAAAGMAAAGSLSLELYLVLIPAWVFALLLIGNSALAWREG